jgi:hypothetical protein
MSPFRQYYDSFDPETLALLEIAFNDAWQSIRTSGGCFDQEATRRELADLIIKFASQGVSDPKRLKALALSALPEVTNQAAPSPELGALVP